MSKRVDMLPRVYRALLAATEIMPSTEILADQCGCTTQTIGVVIKKLEADGRVEVTRDKKGKRVGITIEGRYLRAAPRRPWGCSNEARGEVKIRKCLKCRDKFRSHHAGERICGPCKDTIEWITGEVVAV